MGWGKRGNRFYYYHKRRKGHRVVSEYVGAGPLAKVIADLDALGRERRELEREARRREREEILTVDRALDDVQQMILALARAWLVAAGCHTHKGQWRRRRKRDEGATC